MWRASIAAALLCAPSLLFAARAQRVDRGLLVIVADPDAAVRAQPRADSPVVRTLPLLAEVKRKGQRGAFFRIAYEGGDGWVARAEVAPKTRAGGALYERGMRHLRADEFAKAAPLLDAAARALRSDRRPLVALLAALDGAGKKTEAEAVRERLRTFDRWLHGTWCDGDNRAFVIFAPTGDYYFRLERSSDVANRGRYRINDDQIALDDNDNRSRDLVLKIEQREVGRVLIDRGHREYLQVLCRGDERP